MRIGDSVNLPLKYFTRNRPAGHAVASGRVSRHHERYSHQMAAASTLTRDTVGWLHRHASGRQPTRCQRMSCSTKAALGHTRRTYADAKAGRSSVSDVEATG